MTHRRKFYLNRHRGKIMGVCAGLSDSTGIDVLWIRLSAVALVILGAPFIILIYLITGFVAQSAPREFGESTTSERWSSWDVIPSRHLGDVRSRFRDIDRRLRDIETYVTSSNRGLSAEIDKLR
jgi:phage shock protein C